MRITFSVSALLLVFNAMSADAGIIITAVESGNDVVFTVNGTLDLTGETIVGGGRELGIRPAGSLWFVSTGNGLNVSHYNLSMSDGPFGTGGTVRADSYSGDPFAIWGGNGVPKVFAPNGFTSGSITSGMVFNNHTFASLLMTPGTYNYSVSNDTITMNIGQDIGHVPEPSTFALLCIGSIGLIGNRRRKRKQAA